MIVAIDGPSGAGKSTVAKAVAKELGFSCLDTGAMYRAIAWRALQDGVALDDEPVLGAIARTYDVAFGHVEGDPAPRRVFIGDDEVTDAIRTAEIDRAVSPVSAAPAVREALLDQQRRIGNAGDYVVEGRDIGTVVFPDAAVKVFLPRCDKTFRKNGHKIAPILCKGNAAIVMLRRSVTGRAGICFRPVTRNGRQC